MMNGAIILCNKMYYNDEERLLDLVQVRSSFVVGVSSLICIYFYFAPERLGILRGEIGVTDKTTNERKLLHFIEHGKITITPTDIRRGHLEMVLPGVPVCFEKEGRYSVDLVLDDIIVASTGINVTI